MENRSMMIGIKVAESGKYYFNLKETNSSEIEEIWLKDQFTSTIHNLATGSYEFISEKGEFKNRFRIEVERILNTIECDSTNHALDL